MGLPAGKHQVNIIMLTQAFSTFFFQFLNFFSPPYLTKPGSPPNARIRPVWQPAMPNLDSRASANNMFQMLVSLHKPGLLPSRRTRKEKIAGSSTLYDTSYSVHATGD